MSYDELVKRLREASGDARDTLWWKAADAIDQLEAAVPRWIPVTERLPEEVGKYLCTVKSFSHYYSKQYCYVDVLVFQDDCFFECGLGTERVTHWMPLPQPPKEETE